MERNGDIGRKNGSETKKRGRRIRRKRLPVDSTKDTGDDNRDGVGQTNRVEGDGPLDV